ncbi:MAG: MCP four helix bundle domain-containing protein, partial [Ignavibacteriales bacterium]
MKWFLNLKISTKLLSGFLLIAAIAALIGYLGLYNMALLDDNGDEMYNKQLVPITTVMNMVEDFHRSRVNLREVILSDNTKDGEAFKEKMDGYFRSMTELNSVFEKELLTDEGRRIFAQYKDNYNEFIKIQDEVASMAISGKKNEATVLMRTKGLEATTKVQNSLKEIKDQKVALAKANEDENSITAESAKRITLTVLGIAIVLSVLLGIFISKVISNALRKGVEFAKTIAGGDMTKRFEIDQKDEIGQLSSALNEMVAKIREVVENVKQASDNVATGAQEMSSSSEEMSQGATEQAAAAEEASSSMEEMTSNIRQNADNAQQTERI